MNTPTQWRKDLENRMALRRTQQEIIAAGMLKQWGVEPTSAAIKGVSCLIATIDDLTGTRYEGDEVIK